MKILACLLFMCTIPPLIWCRKPDTDRGHARMDRTGCASENSKWSGPYQQLLGNDGGSREQNWKACGVKCTNNPACKFWEFKPTTGWCWNLKIYGKSSGKKIVQTVGKHITGRSGCPQKAVDGAWGSWSTCSKKCGGGEKTRSCDSPAPAHGGKQCQGDSTEDCNTASCVRYTTPISGCLWKYNTESHYGVSSMEECQSKCDEKSWCRSLDYISDKKICYLSKETKSSKPSSWYKICKNFWRPTKFLKSKYSEKMILSP